MRIDVRAGLCALALTLTIPAAAAAQTAASAPAAEVAVARTIIAETGLMRDFMVGFEQAISATMASNNSMPEAQQRMFMDSLREEALAQESAIVDMFVDVMVATYEQDELEAYLAFARTPVGKRYLARNVQFMTEVQARSEALGQRLVPGTLERFATKVRAAGAN